MSKPREFWLDIATPYGDPCDFIHNVDPIKEAKRLGTYPSVAATNIHVIEYSAHQAALDKIKELELQINHAAIARNEYTLEAETQIKELELSTNYFKETVEERERWSERQLVTLNKLDNKIIALHDIIDEMRKVLELYKGHNVYLNRKYDALSGTEYGGEVFCVGETLVSIDLKLKHLK